MKQAREHLIWDSEINFEDWREDMEAEHPDWDEDDLFELAVDMNREYLEDERVNLNIKLSAPILVVGDLGLWNGRVGGYKEIESGNIADCLYSDCNIAKWYVDELGDLRFEGAHHDGHNSYLYRVWKDNASETQQENLKEKIYNGTATRRDITRLTKRLGDYIGEVYGWKF